MSSAISQPLPPGPAMGRVTGTVAFHRDPLGFLHAARRDSGDVFTIRLATVGPVVVVAEPQAAAGLAALDSGAVGARAHAGQARQAVLPMASARSVFGGDDEKHHQARARAYPAFSPQAIAERSEGIEALVERHVGGWPHGRPLRLLSRMRCLADDVFVREILGVGDTLRAKQLTAAIGRLLWTPGNPPMTIPGQERLKDTPAGDDYERAVVQESLRLHPPALGALRRLTEPATVAGRDLPANTSVMAPIPLLQSDPRGFEHPERFLPERHLSSHSRDLPEMSPFGLGARKCIAEGLARAQLAAVLRALLRHATIHPLGPQPERPVLRATILVPQRSGLALLTEPRNRPVPSSGRH